MNAMQQMKDPAAGVPRELLPHMHLISKNRYPVNQSPSVETIVAYLLEAPKVVRDGQPVQWQFLDCPQDGTLFLTWQPPELGMNYASDGYVWADQEAPFNSEVRGYALQMCMHKAGFRPQGEAMACHSRRRYRLIPSQQSMGGPMPDPSLWLVHYSKANVRDHVAATSVPVAPHIHAQLQQRRVIMSSGALARKEFMLHDRSNWPTINLPGGIGRHSSGQAAQNAHRRGQSLAGHEPTIEEEEDVSRGDALDFMTPRDISRMRYEQHHEWMEEILESPYRTMQIIPPSLGLGRKGELESLTKDFFDAPTGGLQEAGSESSITRVGRLDPGKADEFTKAANQKIADMQLQLQKMKQEHQKRMEKLKRATALNVAEKKLRSAPSEVHSRKSVANGMSGAGGIDTDPVDEIVKEVEETTGKKIAGLKSVTCVSKGGYLEIQPTTVTSSEPPQPAPVSTKTDVDSSKPTTQNQRATSPPKQQQPVQSPSTSASHNGVNAPVSEPTSIKQPTPDDQKLDNLNEESVTLTAGMNTEVDMEDIDDQPQPEDGPSDVNDWVMVDDANMGDNMDTASLEDLAKSIGNDGGNGSEDDQALDETPMNTGFTPGEVDNLTPQAVGQQQQSVQNTGGTPLDHGDFDFDDVNTAGDALADYGADDDDLNLDNMDDSAFGDAFNQQDDHDL